MNTTYQQISPHMHKLSDQVRRLIWIAYYRDLGRWHDEIRAQFDVGDYRNWPKQPKRPDRPELCIGLTCGARTRNGRPCRNPDIYNGGRCRFHGGYSTGPITKAGKKISARNGFRAVHGRRVRKSLGVNSERQVTQPKNERSDLGK